MCVCVCVRVTSLLLDSMPTITITSITAGMRCFVKLYPRQAQHSAGKEDQMRGCGGFGKGRQLGIGEPA